MEMLVTQGLNELKLLDARISRKIDDGCFVGYAKKVSPNVNGRTTKENYISNAKSDYTSITDLIKRRNAIKSAIVKSNAVTLVDISGKSMTVAEAIERKESITYEQHLLTNLERQYTSAVNGVNKENQKVDDAVTQLLITAYGKDTKEKISDTMHDAIAKPYRDNNEYALVDGLGAEKIIKEMKEDIENFLSNVDTALQVSNSTTIINI
jgi:predicted metal-dependent hydrolase